MKTWLFTWNPSRWAWNSRYSKLKREALEKAYVDIGVKELEVKSWDRNQNLKDFLKSLT